jgi:DNA-directed RNA polymerase III subunit RPC11
MRFFCQACPYLFKIDEKVEKKVPLQRKQVDDVLGGAEAWENVDQTEGAWSPSGGEFLPSTGSPE